MMITAVCINLVISAVYIGLMTLFVVCVLNDDIAVCVHFIVLLYNLFQVPCLFVNGAEPDCSAVLCLRPDCDNPEPPPPGQCCASCPNVEDPLPRTGKHALV